MELLPDGPARAWLIDQLAALIAAAGVEPFVSAPVVLPDDRFFPDPWTPDEAGVARLLRRVMALAGLGDLDLTLEIDEFAAPAGEVAQDGRASGHEGTAAWFAGIEGAVCTFGVDVRQLRDPVGLVGTLAHEVAHAYRHHHRLRHDERDLEERLTDLTTVYLGFGILTANSSLQFASGTTAFGSWYRRSARGYLSPQAMTYLLGAAAVARGDDQRAVARRLAANQAACFRAACADVGDRDLLCARLGLPAVPATTQPARRGLLGWLRRR